MHHPDAFPSLDVAFDPQANAAYAARFLKELYAQKGDWTRATAAYHSATPDIGAGYQRKVLAVLPGGIASGKQCPGFTPGAGLGSDDVRGSPWLHAGSAIQSPGAIDAPRLMMLPTVAGATPPGRNLDAYRAAPIRLAYQPPPRRIGADNVSQRTQHGSSAEFSPTEGTGPTGVSHR